MPAAVRARPHAGPGRAAAAAGMVCLRPADRRQEAMGTAVSAFGVTFPHRVHPAAHGR
ncbi:hypothetical protein T261_04004 [Streptomyces lydicus]|nr:hypothetical protein T261_04004 [Streptomyces lydicus]